MLLRYRDPNFWKKFQAKHWQPRVPTVIRQPFKDFPFPEDSLLAAMKAFEQSLRGKNPKAHCLVSVGDKEKAPRRPLQKLFQQENGSLEQLEQNCARVFPKQRFGLMVTRFEVVDPGIWDPITAFLQDARQGTGDNFPRAFLDLFYGNYLSTFTGLHKDTQEIFAFVVRGKKRILAWPFDYFLPKVKGLSAGSRFFHMRLPVDPKKYRKDAIVLDADPGDMLYWPSDHWHVAETIPGNFSAMISLGLFRQDFLPQAAGPVTARQLRWETGFGFELGGPKGKKAAESVAVMKKESCLLRWMISRGRCLVAANGHSLTLPHSSKLESLLVRLAKGERVSRDQGAPLVDWLLRVSAVEPYQKVRGTF